MSVTNFSNVTNAIASGTTLQTGYPINAILSQFSTVTGSAYAVTLPSNPTPNQEYFIRNDGASTMSIFPANSTSIINGGSAGSAVTLASGSQVGFICTQTDAQNVYVDWYSVAGGSGG